MDAKATRRWFGDALVSYDWRDRDARDQVAASAEMIALGVDGEALRALASKVVTPLTSPFDMDALIGDPIFWVSELLGDYRYHGG